MLRGSVANITINTKAQIADLDKPLDAAGFADAASALEVDLSGAKPVGRMISAFQQIITDPNKPAMPEEVITFLRN